MSESASKRVPLSKEQEAFISRLIKAGKLPDTPLTKLRLRAALLGLGTDPMTRQAYLDNALDEWKELDVRKKGAYRTAYKFASFPERELSDLILSIKETKGDLSATSKAALDTRLDALTTSMNALERKLKNPLIQDFFNQSFWEETSDAEGYLDRKAYKKLTKSLNDFGQQIFFLRNIGRQRAGRPTNRNLNELILELARVYISLTGRKFIVSRVSNKGGTPSEKKIPSLLFMREVLDELHATVWGYSPISEKSLYHLCETAQKELKNQRGKNN